jgi:dipeptidyl aminopeptidase/acylaminoacyl peptidase
MQSAYQNGSEAGYAMQDDKDDGALYLAEQGLADAKQMAMFGWSYGGYAALVAASRTPQIYQCTIAGAAVTDMVYQLNNYLTDLRLRGASKIQQVSYRKGAINPIDEVENINIPLLMIHGDVDQRVMPKHARLYLDKLDDAQKPYKMVWLEGADHFSNTLFYEHKIILYKELTEFLASDSCFGKKDLLSAASN